MMFPTILKNIKRLTGLTSVLLILCLIACGRKQTRADCFNYPKQIDSLQVQDLYDTARLYIFTWLCDEKIDNYYRAQFELKYESFFMRNDSLEIFFSNFLPKDLKDSTTISDYNHLPSIGFNIKKRKKLWGWDINGFSNALKPGDLRFESPSSPEVINFIKTHNNLLNPCFLALIEKANLIGK